MGSLTKIFKQIRNVTGTRRQIKPEKEIFYHPQVRAIDTFEQALSDEKMLVCSIPQSHQGRMHHAAVLQSFDADKNEYIFKNSYIDRPEISLPKRKKVPEKGFHIRFRNGQP